MKKNIRSLAMKELSNSATFSLRVSLVMLKLAADLVWVCAHYIILTNFHISNQRNLIHYEKITIK